MNFDNLKMAIELNQSETPSLTLAFYMIQSIVKDMEHESGGKDFRSIDIGNIDEYTGLLGNQLRVLLRTYQSTVTHIQGNLTKLECLQQELMQVQNDLKTLEDAIANIQVTQTELEAKKEQEKVLRQVLEQRQQLQTDYDALCRECEQLQEQIDAMEHYDLAEKTKERDEWQKKYDAFDQQVISLNQEIQHLTTALNDIQTQKASAEKQKNDLEKQSQNVTEELITLQNRIHELTISITQTNVSIDKLQGENRLLEDTYHQAQQTAEAAKKEQVQLSDEYNDFYVSVLEPLEKNNDSLRHLLANKEQEKAKLTETSYSLEEKTNQLLIEIANLQSDIVSLNKSIQERSNTKELLEQEKKEKLESLRHISEELESIQQEIAAVKENIRRLEENVIPQSRITLQNVYQDHDAIRASYQKLLETIEELNRNIDELNAQYQSGSTERQHKQNELDELRQKLTANHQEIERLNTVLEELKGKTDPEKVIALKKNLEQEIETYHQLLKDQTAYDKECQQKRTDNDKSRQIIVQLQSTIDQYEEDKKRLDKKLTVLQQVNDPSFEKKAQLVKERVRIASQIKESLEEYSAKMKKVLGVHNAPVLNELHEELAVDLKEISSYLDHLFSMMTKMSQELFNNLEEGE